MTIKELREALSKFPDDMKVYVDFDRYGGNETEASEVTAFYPRWMSYFGEKPGVRIG